MCLGIKNKGLYTMRSDIDKLIDKLFADCCFDPDYMDERYTRERFRIALESLDDMEYEYIRDKIYGPVAQQVVAVD